MTAVNFVIEAGRAHDVPDTGTDCDDDVVCADDVKRYQNSSRTNEEKRSSSGVDIGVARIWCEWVTNLEGNFYWIGNRMQ